MNLDKFYSDFLNLYYSEFSEALCKLPYEDVPLEAVYYVPRKDLFMLVKLAEEDYFHVTLGNIDEYYNNNFLKNFILFEDAILLGYL